MAAPTNAGIRIPPLPRASFIPKPEPKPEPEPAQLKKNITYYQVLKIIGIALVGPFIGIIRVIYNVARILFAVFSFCCRDKEKLKKDIVDYGKQLGRGLAEITIIGSVIFSILDLRKKPSPSNPIQKEAETHGKKGTTGEATHPPKPTDLPKPSNPPSSHSAPAPAAPSGPVAVNSSTVPIIRGMIHYTLNFYSNNIHEMWKKGFMDNLGPRSPMVFPLLGQDGVGRETTRQDIRSLMEIKDFRNNYVIICEIIFTTFGTNIDDNFYHACHQVCSFLEKAPHWEENLEALCRCINSIKLFSEENLWKDHPIEHRKILLNTYSLLYIIEEVSKTWMKKEGQKFFKEKTEQLFKDILPYLEKTLEELRKITPPLTATAKEKKKGESKDKGTDEIVTPGAGPLPSAGIASTSNSNPQTHASVTSSISSLSTSASMSSSVSSTSMSSSVSSTSTSTRTHAHTH